MKKQWFFVALLVGALALAVTGGTVLAQSNDTTGGTSPVKTFAARVAEKLGLQEAQVQDAMKQAATEMHDEHLKAKLAKAVAAGRITQAQADELYAWYQARPDVAMGLGMGKHGFGGRGHGRMFGPGMDGFGMPHAPAQTTPPTPQGSGA